MPGTEETKSVAVVVDQTIILAGAYNGEDFSVVFSPNVLYRCVVCNQLFNNKALFEHTRWHLNRQKETDAAKALQAK